MYRFVGTMALLIGLISCAMFNPNLQEQTIVYNAKHYVKKVTTPEGSYCSSIYVNYKNKVRHITNAHCCRTSLLLNNEPMSIVKVDVPNDLCELKDKVMPAKGINISLTKPQVTNNIYTVGYPANYNLTISTGRIVTDLTPSSLNGQFLYQTTAFVFGGSSGGAALDENGRLIGVVCQTNELAHGMFIPITSVVNFLN